MPQDKNSLLRVLVPFLLILVGLGVAYAVFKNSAQSRTPTPSQTSPAPGSPAGGAAPGVPTLPAALTPAPAGPIPPAIAGLHARIFDDAGSFAPLGDLDPAGKFMARLEFSRVGAGLATLRLSQNFDTIERRDDEHTLVQCEQSKAKGSTRPTLTPLGALGITINGTLIDLSGLVTDATGPITQHLWRQVEPGSFEAIILGADDRPVARISRRYELTPGSYDVILHQAVDNLSGAEIAIRWYQLGPVELPRDVVTYGGDKRRLRFGYLPAATINPGRQYVAADDFLWPREAFYFPFLSPSPEFSLLGPKDKATGTYRPLHPVWPNIRSKAEGYDLAWVGMTSRYFGVAVHPLVDPAGAAPDKQLRSVASVNRLLLDAGDVNPLTVVAAVRFNGPETRIAPGASLDLGLGMYAGPLSHPIIEKDDSLSARLMAAGIDGIVAYNFGGPCAFCTFTWITGSLLWLLHLLHDYILHDWALSIIFLVVCVRTILHPVTKWSQIRVQRFSKQLQAMGPKQKQIQEKYGSDKKKIQEETARLWKEEGINPVGMLGCLPMFLQDPVWIALYAMLYFAFELRQQPAFFGVFQKLTGGRWWFLSDLAEPDRAVYFHKIIATLPIMGGISSINILPFILAIVFYGQQKYLAPPPSAAMTPEQQQQQTMMKWMTVIMFPLMMYAAPSGLALYFIANSTIAIFESRYIRAHIKKNDLLNPKHPGKPTGGFMKHLTEIADRQRQAVQNSFGQSRPARPGDKGRADPRRPGGEPPPKRFKDR